MLNKKGIFNNPSVAISMLMLLSGVANFANADATTPETASHVLDVRATIPSATFKVEPVTGVWPSVVTLPYAESTKTFLEYKIPMKVLANEGLYAFVGTEPNLRNGATIVPLTVTMNGTDLTTTPASIIKNATQGSSQTHYMDLVVKGTSAISGSPVSGRYAGTVDLQFEDKY